MSDDADMPDVVEGSDSEPEVDELDGPDEDEAVAVAEAATLLNELSELGAQPEEEDIVAAYTQLCIKDVAEQRKEMAQLPPEEQDLSAEAAELAKDYGARSARCIGLLQRLAPVCAPANLAEAAAAAEDVDHPLHVPRHDVRPALTGTLFEGMLNSLYAKPQHGASSLAEVMQLIVGSNLMAAQPERRAALVQAVVEAHPPGTPLALDARQAYNIGRAVSERAAQAFFDAAAQREAEAQQSTIDADGIVGRSGPGMLASASERREHAIQVIANADPLFAACASSPDGFSVHYRPIEQVLLCASGLPCFDGMSGQWRSAYDVAVEKGFLRDPDQAAAALESAYAILDTVKATHLPEDLDPGPRVVCMQVYRNAAWLHHLRRVFSVLAQHYAVPLAVSPKKHWVFTSASATFDVLVANGMVKSIMSGSLATFDYVGNLDQDYWPFVDAVISSEDALGWEEGQRVPLGGADALPFTTLGANLAGIACTSLAVVGLALVGVVAAGLVWAIASDPDKVLDTPLCRVTLQAGDIIQGGWEALGGAVDSVCQLAGAELTPDADTEAMQRDLLTRRESQIVFAGAGLGFLTLFATRMLNPPPTRPAGQGYDWISDALPLANTVYSALVYKGLSAMVAVLGSGPYLQRLLEQTAKGVIFRSTSAYLQDALHQAFKQKAGFGVEPAADVIITSLAEPAPAAWVPRLFGYKGVPRHNPLPKMTALARALTVPALIGMPDTVDVEDIIKAAAARALLARAALKPLVDGLAADNQDDLEPEGVVVSM